QVEAAEIDLAVVHLGGGEIRVDGQRGIQGWRQSIEGIKRWFQRTVRVTTDMVLAPVDGDTGHDIQTHALVQTSQPGDLAGDTGIIGTVVGNPGHFLAASTDGTTKVEAPGVDARIERQ